MTDTTFETAARCPECEAPGKVVLVTPIPQGKVHTFECAAERCPRTGERWIVQTNPDGSIPQRTQGPKTFPKLNHNSPQAQRARDELRILDFQTTHPGLSRREIVQILGG
jgi:hypothetical protein